MVFPPNAHYCFLILRQNSAYVEEARSHGLAPLHVSRISGGGGAMMDDDDDERGSTSGMSFYTAHSFAGITVSFALLNELSLNDALCPLQNPQGRCRGSIALGGG